MPTPRHARLPSPVGPCPCPHGMDIAGCLQLLSTGQWCPSVCPQGDVYCATTQRLVDSVVSGYNATVFAYGPSGTGCV